MKPIFCLLFGLALLSTGVAQEAPVEDPLRVGVAGMTHGHVHWILRRAADPDVEIVGVAEPNQELAERLLHQYGLSEDLWYPDLASMLEAGEPEAMTAFGNIYDHLSVVEACAPRGIHVMVEKPLAVSLDHARQMADLATNHGIHLLTNYETTWYGSNHALYREMLVEFAHGEIRKMVVHDGHPGPIEIGCDPEFVDWLINPELNGAGALTDFGCYGANLITWLMKNQRPLSVTAITQTLKPEKYPKVDDDATILLQYPSAQGIIQASWNWPISRKDLHVYGTTGYVKTIDGSKMVRCPKDGAAVENFEAPTRPEPEHDPFAYFRAVVRGKAFAGGSLSSLENNLLVMEILEAAKQSAAEGRTIALD